MEPIMHTPNPHSIGKLITLLMAGATAAVLVFALGKTNTHRLHAKLEQLVLVCIAEALDDGDKAAEEQVPLCDPTTLTWTASASRPYRDVRAEIVATQATIWQLDSLLVPLVSAILVLTAAPWTSRFVRTQITKLRKEQHGGMAAPGS